MVLSVASGLDEVIMHPLDHIMVALIDVAHGGGKTVAKKDPKLEFGLPLHARQSP